MITKLESIFELKPSSCPIQKYSGEEGEWDRGRVAGKAN